MDYLAPRNLEDKEVVTAAEITSPKRETVVAEQDGDIVGWGSVHLDKQVIAATFVATDAARDGIGTTLIEHLESVAREGGIDTLRVFASLNTVGFYDEGGFERQGPVDAGTESSPSIPSIEMTRSLS